MASNEIHKSPEQHDRQAGPSHVTEHLQNSAKATTGVEQHVAAAGHSAKMVENKQLPPCEIHDCSPHSQTAKPDGKHDNQPNKPESRHDGTGATTGKTAEGHAENHHAQKGNHESSKHHHKHHHHKKHHRHHGGKGDSGGGGAESHDGASEPNDTGAGPHGAESAPENNAQRPGAPNAPEACKDQGGDQKQQFQDMLKKSGINSDGTNNTKGTEGASTGTSDGKTVSGADRQGATTGDGRLTNGQKPANDGTTKGVNNDGRTVDGRRPGDAGAVPGAAQPGNVTDQHPGELPKPAADGTQSSPKPKFEGGAKGDSPDRPKNPSAIDGSKGDSPDPSWFKGRNINQSGPELSQTYAQNFKVNIPFAQAQA